MAASEACNLRLSANVPAGAKVYVNDAATS